MSSSKGNTSSVGNASSVGSTSSSTSKQADRVLTYNTITGKFAYVARADLEEYPRSQVQEVEVGRFCNGVTFDLSGSNGAKVQAKIDFPPDVIAARVVGRWKELYVIRGVEGIRWKYG